MDKKVKFEDLLAIAKSMIENDITEEKTRKFLDGIKIYGYIPIAKKFEYAEMINAMDLFADTADFPSSYVAAKLEVIRKMLAIKYYTNVDVENDEMTFANYDMLMSSGLYDILSKPFEKDYKRLCDVVRDSIGIRNITDVSSMLASYNHKQVTKDIKEINKLFDNNEDFKNVLEILKFNNPYIK